MILQALVQLYEDLAAQERIARPGWSPAKISFALCLDENGTLTQVIPTQVERQSGRKTVLAPQTMVLPAAVTRTGKSIKPFFLWDNASYLLGIDKEANEERAIKRFEGSKQLHHKLLDSVDHPAARAILAFFDHWDPKEGGMCVQLRDSRGELLKGGNLVFRVNGVFAQNVAELVQAWNRYYNEEPEGTKSQCLITGNYGTPERTHPWIKGVTGDQSSGDQSSGAAIVSFNAPAFCSYGKKQSFNAPVGKAAAFAYTAALNHLLADRENVHRIGDTTVVCWAEGAEPGYDEFFRYFTYGDHPPEQITTEALQNVVSKLAKGLPCEELPLDLSRRFYILGLAPNAARLAVRFFYNSTFGELMKNIAAHHERMEITGSRFSVVPLWALLAETVNQKTNDKTPSPVMAGAVARAVFNGTPYPASLLQAVMLRIRAERDVTPGRAAILKAYYLKNRDTRCPEEVLTVSLNETSTNVPYTLGRLFAVYEAVQEAANPGLNATIKDKYFNSASATPGMIFPVLNKLCQKHLRKLRAGRRKDFDEQIRKLKEVFGEAYPDRLSLPEQGTFDLGYYHQKDVLQKKEEQ